MRCTNCEMDFETLHGVPVLVHFGESVLERTATIETAAKSPVRARVRRFGKPHPQVAKNLVQLSDLVASGSRLLVVGGGEDSHGLAYVTDRADLDTITFDIYASELTDFVADAHSIPLRSGSVDCVVIQAVLEHVLNPWQVAEELHRVLRVGGLVYAETPFMQQVHEAAYDFTRFTESGHRWLFRKFDMVASGGIGGPLLVLAWTSEFLLSGAGVPKKVRNVCRRVLTWLSRWDQVLNRNFNADCASAVYFLGRKRLEGDGIDQAGIIDFYTRSRS